MLFLVLRQDCTSFAPAREIDPDYARALVRAERAGVEILVYGTRVRQAGIELTERMA